MSGCWQPSSDLDVREVTGRCEGYSGSDLRTVFDRAAHAAASRILNDATGMSEDTGGKDTAAADAPPIPLMPLIHEDGLSLELIVSAQGNTMERMGSNARGVRGGDARTTMQQCDFDAALDGFTPASLQGAALFKSDTKWSDVGGLLEVRRVLKETLEMPARFAALYDASPLRLPSGVLLFGPPGCGKTMLAGAVASECGLNFISVKGPEVLNKYDEGIERDVVCVLYTVCAVCPCCLLDLAHSERALLRVAWCILCVAVCCFMVLCLYYYCVLMHRAPPASFLFFFLLPLPGTSVPVNRRFVTSLPVPRRLPRASSSSTRYVGVSLVCVCSAVQ